MVLPGPERVVFSSIFEALHRVVRDDQPELSAAARALGVNLERLDPAYPVDVWRKLTTLVAQALYPQVTGPVAEYRLGQRLFREYGSTLMGRALLGTLRVLGPRRAFSRVSRSFRTANNFTEDRVTQHAPTHFELWLNELDTPYLNQGVMQAALEAAGARNCSVEVLKRDAEGTTYRCGWD